MTSPSSDTTRLYITPFTSELLPLVLPASIRPLATDVSFHDLPTFPENNYGYVTLPAMEADKIKKKLNGSILKGRKFKVEAARPQKRQRDEEDSENVVSKVEHSSDKKSKKRKAEENVLDGYELPSDRKVKRGWTESANDKVERRKKEKKQKGTGEKDAKPQTKSKYSEKSECLFRTKVPANKSLSLDDKSSKSKKRNKSSSDTVVHEYSKTITQPSFLREEENGTVLTSTFEEGKGWIDEQGNLKENVSDRIKKKEYTPGQVPGYKEKAIRTKTVTKAENAASSNSKSRKSGPVEGKESTDEAEDWTSSSGSSSSDDDTTDSESEDSASSSSSEESSVASDEEENQLPPSKGDRPKSDAQDSTAKSETDPDHEQQPKEVHPLEALFKKPAPVSPGKKAELEAPTQFSFFGQEDLESEEEQESKEPIEPLTPFTKRDFEGRGLRSAAPTPDTTQVGRSINWNLPGHSDSTGVEASPYANNSPLSKAGPRLTDESDFTKWFWENRGDNNRAWKKRRRDVAKEQRQRENRRKGMKGKS
ncbi:hypothetical protein ARAM_002449 [Aspergillus rambellii]|uniref:Suppressor protein n=1 Tax=Aspergillus rambellii TaxID=308745 RepID=A0A0F8V058_9EURO|nr:hypothetical protein ARAM_002449 [Aspergillus rambellii]